MCADLKCAMCSHFMLEGTECGSCHQVFCRRCCSEKLTSAQCPSCLKSDEFDPQNSNLSEQKEKTQSEVRLYCKFQSLGCGAEVSVKELLNHELSQCGVLKQNVECSGCKGTFNASEYLLHENTCDLLEMQCKICHMTLPKKLRKEHTRVVCVFQKMKAAENTAIKDLMYMKSHLNKVMAKAKQLNNHMMVECKSCSKYCGYNANTKCANCQEQYCIRCSKNSKSCQNPACGLFYCKSCGVDKLYSNRKCRVCNMSDMGDRRMMYGSHHMPLTN